MICLYCHSRIREEADLITMFKRQKPLCMPCRKKLSLWRPGERCASCHRLMDRDECPDCRFLAENYRRPGKIMCMMDYTGEVKMLFHRYKFTKDAALSEVIAMFLKCRFGEYDMSIPIPVSAARMEERGYNQTSMVLRAAKVPYRDILATDKAERQSEHSRRARLTAPNPFHLKDDWAVSSLAGKRVLVVDDIYTTGITVHQALEKIYTLKPCAADVLTFSKA
ncbi:ComF family protein [Salinicoccus carnicancri]|uniref:ComF family protein n=1 Tax=Salinicoccus carnicancri TaxID=558170 RepID=UPI0003084508|nr:phosphoribosyltransferase family protein [Salinicoccus carnicancri]